MDNQSRTSTLMGPIMSEYVEVTEPITTAAGTFRVCVEYDLHGVNPREDFDQLGTMVCQANRDYHMPREGDQISPYLIEEAVDRGGWRLAVRYLSFAGAVVLPLYGAESVSAGELGETIDDRSAVSGVIYALRSDIAAQWEGHPMPSDTDIAGWLAGEVATYRAWATGEMFGYVIERMTDGCDCDTDTEDHECWSVIDSCWGYYDVDDATSMGRDAVPTEREVTDAQWLAELFEFELCGECGRDAEQHTVSPDPVGLRHAHCTDPIPAGLSEADAQAELARRCARHVEVTEPATAYAAIRLAGTVSGYGPVRMRWTERTLSPSRILATWWQETGELASVAVYGNSTDQGLASKVVYWLENLADAPPWVREFVTDHQPDVRTRDASSIAAGLIAESADGTIGALFDPLHGLSGVERYNRDMIKRLRAEAADAGHCAEFRAQCRADADRLSRELGEDVHTDAHGRVSRDFTSAAGRTWSVRIVPAGAPYGMTDSLTDNGPMVEFFDATYAGETFGPLGQFASRYYVDTLLGRDRYSSGGGEGGLTLQGGIAEWSIDCGTMGDIRAWVVTVVY